MSKHNLQHILAEAGKERRWRWIPTRSEQEIRKMLPLLVETNRREADLRQLTEDRLPAKTAEFRERLDRGATPDDLLPEAFALVREAARRRLNMRHFDVQILGGIVLYQGKIAEMVTGEGKTLAATLPLYLLGLPGKGAHLVTVNDYLARRDREWMGPVYEALGMSVGAIQHESSREERQAAYRSDITYGTNNEFGFDYLRDNMVLRKDDLVQRPLHYAIVDEVDSILIDEARTPLIISGPAEASTGLYYDVDKVVRQLLRDKKNYELDQKARAVYLTEDGILKAEQVLGVENLYDTKNFNLIHHIEQALKAHLLFRRDQEYLVKDGKVVIVDEFTGRAMEGRRFSDGLHQALEAKEGVRIEAENQTLATISFQNYFRLYQKLAGMTGTAYTEVVEFKNIYGLEVVSIPPNRPLIRREEQDLVYKTEAEKFTALADEIERRHKEGQPLLVGTISIEKSERLSRRLTRRSIPHQVLNAKYHEKEAGIVAEAGRRNRVTIATNMAGRGTDIVLGGSQATAEDWGPEHQALAAEIQKRYPTVTPEQVNGKSREALEVLLAGGLHILGSERHEARRIDNQLRGRSGRQGDPGSSQFFLSLEDDLLHIFGSERITGLMSALPEGEPITNPLLTRMIENAQRRVEGQNFEIRKQLVDFDNVMNEQRRVIYEMRQQILEGKDLSDQFREFIREMVAEGMAQHFPPQIRPEEGDRDGFVQWFENLFRFAPQLPENKEVYARRETLETDLAEQGWQAYREKRNQAAPENADRMERHLFLFLLDSRWKSHLYDMDHLREGISLRAYGQKDPLIAYKSEGFELFARMLEELRRQLTGFLFSLTVRPPEETGGPREVLAPADFQHRRVSAFAPRETADAVLPGPNPEKPGPVPAESGPRVGRNNPCPCGSGKKYKRCCGVRRAA